VIDLNSESNNYILDTYAWIEYFIGSKNGEIVEELIKTGDVSTSVISISELSDKYYRNGLLSKWNKRFQFILNKSKILSLTLEIAKNSGLRKWNLRKKNKTIGLADAIIYETAIQYNLKIVTGDMHFEKLENILFLKDE